MKSVIITLLMFVVVFSLVSFNVLDIVDNSIFSYLVRFLFLIVLLCAVIFIGLPQNKYTTPLLKFMQRFKINNAEKQENKTKQKRKSTAKRRGKNV